MNDDNVSNAGSSAIMRYAIEILKQAIKDISEGKCDEKELTETMARFHPENNGYFKEEDYINYDEVGQLLQLGWDRKKVRKICKEHNIPNVKVNNQHIGFSRKEILKLKDLISK